MVAALLTVLAGGCTVSYKFNGASIDYTKVKSISITDFPNMAELVYAPLSSTFSEALRDKYTRQTKLQLLRTGGDLDVQGEIVGYDYVPLSIGTDALAAQTRLSLTVNVRFTNRQNPEEDFEKRYTASQTFDSNQMLNDVQDELLALMPENGVDIIMHAASADIERLRGIALSARGYLFAESARAAREARRFAKVPVVLTAQNAREAALAAADADGVCTGSGVAGITAALGAHAEGALEKYMADMIAAL